MPAIPPHDTAVVDESWDADANVSRILDTAGKETLRAEYAWVDPDADEDTKAAYRFFPHHAVDTDGKPGAANLNACRNGLARLSNSDVPDADHDGVRRHLQHHLDAQDRQAAAERAEALAAAALETATGQDTDPAAVYVDRDTTGSSDQLSEGRVEAGGTVLDAAEHAADKDAPRPLERLLGKPWAITHEALIEIGARLTQTSPTRAGEIEAARSRPTATRPAADGSEVAIIPLRGTITPRGSLFSLLFGGGGGLQMFREQFRQAMADGNVSAIVLDVDSPGGLIDLVPEAAAEVRAARGGKPIVAIANTVCASAAYWIAAQADQFVVTPSGQAGSIGVYSIHEDVSRLEEMLGIKTTLISAGPFKVDGNPYEPLSKSAQQALQQEVDDLYAMFVNDVAAGRGVSAQAVKAGYGRGRCVLAEEAVRVGIADRIETFEQVLARLGGREKDPEPTVADLLDDDCDDDVAPVTKGEITQPPVRATEDDGAHEGSDYLSGEALREQAWL